MIYLTSHIIKKMGKFKKWVLKKFNVDIINFMCLKIEITAKYYIIKF